MPRQLRVFLCHASQDKPAVWKLHRYLKQHGISPWLDQADLLPGQNWEVEIPKALFNSDVILVCLSKSWINKEGYVQKEIVFALDKALEKPPGTIFIIPVKLEECDVPNRLSRYQWVDYYRAAGRRRLLMGLNLRAQSLGEEIAAVVMEDSKQRMPQERERVAQDITVKSITEQKMETERLTAKANAETTKLRNEILRETQRQDILLEHLRSQTQRRHELLVKAVDAVGQAVEHSSYSRNPSMVKTAINNLLDAITENPPAGEPQDAPKTGPSAPRTPPSSNQKIEDLTNTLLDFVKPQK